MQVEVKHIDIAGWKRCMRDLMTSLYGAGKGGDLQKFLQVESGQLAWDISNALGPRTKESARRDVERNLLSSLSFKPRYENLLGEQKESSWAEFTWLAAGNNFLLGINDEDNRRDASPDEALQAHYAARKHPRGKRYVEIGRRGKQHIVRLNRMRVSRSAFNDVRNYIQASIGQLRASFAASAARLLPGKRIPGWVRDQINAVEINGKTIFDDAGLSNQMAPSLIIGSRAKGVESNARVINRIAGAIERRKVILVEKARKIAAGYAYDWNSGKVFRGRIDRNT